MDRSKFVRIYSHNDANICICCDEFVVSNAQKDCPPHTHCGCSPSGNGHHQRNSICTPFNNTKDKIIATIIDCKSDEIYGCDRNCDTCNFSIAKLKYLESL